MTIWALIAAVTFDAWETSNFQLLQSIHEGGPWAVRNGVELGLPLAVLLLTVLVAERQVRTRRPMTPLVRRYVWLGLFTAVTILVWGGPTRWLVVAEGVLFAFVMDTVLEEPGRLRKFLWGNALLGTACIALNSVTVLHFRGLLTLPSSYMERIGGGWEASGNKVLTFGVFGRTEWQQYPVQGVWWNRLHGWSFEPIHWAYFVLWTIVCCLVLFQFSETRRARRFLGGAIVLAIGHLYFVYSAAAFIVIALTLVVIAWHTLALRIGLVFSRLTIYAGVVFGLGLAGRVALAMTPRVAQMIPEEQVLSRGDNWESKVAFVRLGPAILTRVVPNPAMAEGAGHNLVLSTYLAFGAIGVLPLLAFEWMLLKSTLHARRRSIDVAALLSLVAINHQVPWQIFYPIGATWVVALGHAANLAAAPPAVEADAEAVATIA